MEIRRTGDTGPLPPTPKPLRAPATPKQRESAASQDGFLRQEAPAPDETPFWLVRMSTDRLSGRQYQSAGDRRMAARLEEAWVCELITHSLPAARRYLSAPGQGPAGALAALQALADGVVAAARSAHPAGPFGTVRTVWLADKQTGRGQLVFQVSGNLVQLKPDVPPAATPPAAWLETLAHETFHHLQQELVTALYQGDDLPEPDLALLAAYYRDARAVYKPPSAFKDAAAHRKQVLEVGAWTFGSGLARQAQRR